MKLLKILEVIPKSLEVVEVVLVQCDLVDDWYQQKSEVLHSIIEIFIRSKSESDARLLNVAPSVF